MWKIQYIECENFISFKKAKLEIPQNACTLIYGINNDNIQQRNNGTGKSSIIEAVSFILTGEPLRQVSKVEEIINDNADSANVYAELFNDYDNSMLTIERTIDRKSPQVVECHKYNADDVEIEQDKTSQPTVLDYNRYILEEIGLTKDDIYSNFILSNSKYKSFFDASDKAKKAMINRFSGADAVDDAIERLNSDRSTVEEQLNAIRSKKVAIEAKIDVVNSQLAEADDKREEWEQNKQKRIANLQEQIAQKREELREINANINKGNEYLDKVDEVGSKIEGLSSCGISLNEAYNKIVELMDVVRLSKIKDYVAISKTSKDRIKEYSSGKEILQDSLAEIQEKHLETTNALNELKANLAEQKLRVKGKREELAQKIASVNERISNLAQLLSNNEAALSDTVAKISLTENNISRLKTKIGGAIACPRCQHKFFVASDMAIDEAQSKLLKEQNEKEALLKSENTLKQKISDCRLQKLDNEKQKELINGEIAEYNDELAVMLQKVSGLNAEADSAKMELNSVKSKIAIIDGDIGIEQAKINGLLNKMFTEALDEIDSTIDKGESKLKMYQAKAVSCQAAIESLKKSIEEICGSSQDDFVVSLQKSKAEFEKELNTVLSDLRKVQEEYDKFIVQEGNFAEFRSYLANKKVKAISGVTNHFLELIGSDLRVEMLGFKKLKSGKIRDKITVNLLRNGVDCGSYAKFSGGERARVNLASILGLQRLTNNAAPKGKGLDLIVLDEILEASDTAGIESSCAALNRLKVTSLLVTQNPITDNDGHTIIVTKENGFSTITKE